MKFGREDWDKLGIEGLDEKIDDDEPVFLVRGSDHHASTVLRFAAFLICQSEGLEYDHPMMKSIEEQARKMSNYKRNKQKAPDMPKKVR